MCMCVRGSHCVDLFSLSPCPVLCSASAVFKGITLLCESLSSVGVSGSSTTQDKKKKKNHHQVQVPQSRRSHSNDCPIL